MERMKIPKISILQDYASKLAKGLGIDCQPILRWKQKLDNCSELATHCHTMDVSGQKRGVICLKPSELRRAKYGWQAIIAHEVCHLHIRNCDQPEFIELIEKLGFPKGCLYERH